MTDEALASIKRQSPADMVRLHMAGDEAQAALSERLSEDAFFHGESGGMLGPLAISERRIASLKTLLFISHAVNVQRAVSGGLDDEVARRNRNQPRPTERDVTGPDYTAWTYDLFRPDEPYRARGPHPSGRGIDRYRTTDDLTDAELDFLRLQSRLVYLNLLDPAFFNVGWIEDAKGRRWTGSLNHHFTPFGYQLEWTTRYLDGGLGIEGDLRMNVNRQLWLPELEVGLRHLRIGTSPVRLSPQLALWLQPEELRFDTGSVQVGGAARLRASVAATDWLRVFTDVGAKTAGWHLGNVYLGPRVDASLGTSLIVR